MDYEDIKDEEENEDEEEKEESSESSENANAGNNTQAPVNTPAPTPANNQPATAQQPAAPVQTSTLPENSPYGNGGQGANSAASSQNQGQQQSGKYDNLTDAQIDYLVKNIDQLSEEDKKTVQALADQRKQAGTQTQTGNNLYNSLYGRTGKEGYGKDSYVYSYSAKQLQNDINKQIIARNKEAVKTGHPENVMSLIKEDGLMGYKTKEAMDKLGMDTSMYNYAGGGSSSAPAPSSSGTSVSGDEGSAALAAPNRPMTGNSMSAALADAAKRAEEEAKQKAINDTLNGNNNLPEDAPPMQISNGNNQATNLGDALSSIRLGRGAQAPEELNGNPVVHVPSGQSGVGDQSPSGSQNPEVAELEAAYQANNGGHLMETPSAPTGKRNLGKLDPNFFDEDGFYDAYLRGNTPESAYKQAMDEGILDPETISRMSTAYADYLDEKGLYPGMPRRGEGTNESPATDSNTVTAQREPINYTAMLDELNQMDRNDWYQRPEPQQTSDTEVGSRGLGGRPMGSQRPETSFGFEEDNQEPTARFSDIPFVQGVKDVYDLFAHGYGPREEPKEQPDSQSLEYSDAFIRQQDMNDAYSPRQTFNDSYMAQLERMQEQPSQPIEYSDAFIRQQDQMDAYSPYADYSGSMASDDVQSSGMASTPRQLTRAEGVSQVGDSMSRALADNQAQPTTNIFAQDAPPVISPERENQYKTLFNNEMNALSQMYPDASFSQLYDYLNLFYQQNGDTDTEYYRWFNSFL